jgi:hypothetical protein
LNPFIVIANNDSSEAELLDAINALSMPAHEPPTFWLDLANNQDYSPIHRRHCICQFFRRHVRPGMTLTKLGRVLGHPAWLQPDDIDIVQAVIGELPVAWSPEDTIVTLRIHVGTPGLRAAAYIKIAGKVRRSHILTLLFGGSTKQEGDPSIQDIGLAC